MLQRYISSRKLPAEWLYRNDIRDTSVSKGLQVAQSGPEKRHVVLSCAKLRRVTLNNATLS